MSCVRGVVTREKRVLYTKHLPKHLTGGGSRRSPLNIHRGVRTACIPQVAHPFTAQTCTAKESDKCREARPAPGAARHPAARVPGARNTVAAEWRETESDILSYLILSYLIESRCTDADRCCDRYALVRCVNNSFECAQLQ